VAALAVAYGRQVFHVAHRLFSNTSQAEDVQQEVFLRVLGKPPAEVASWAAYLSAMATRISIDRLRRHTRWRHLLPIWVASAAASAVGRRQLRRGRKTASQAKGGKREQRLRRCAILGRQN
jgi:DNA-directed RNA polymerase specialized sigma24 family protein